MIALIPLVGFAIITVMSLNTSSKLGAMLDDTYSDLLPAVDNYNKLVTERMSFGYYAYGSIVSLGNAKDREYFNKKLEECWKNQTDLMAFIEKKDKDPDEIKILERYNKVKDDYIAVNTELMSLLKSDKPDDNRKAFDLIKKDGKWHKITSEFKYTFVDEIELHKTQSLDGDKEQEALRASTRNLLILFSTFSCLITFSFLMFIAVKITRTVSNISDQLSGASSQVGQAITQLSIAGQTLSQQSTSAAASLEETVASLEEMSSMVKMNSDNAKQAASLSQSSKDSAEVGEREIKNLITSMNDISSSSKKIEEIIHVIDDIAFQTNLLALNAAVEAARAGEQGKGFAVVAEAVRALAQRSALAAKDINGLIKDSVEKITHGTQIADKSGEALNSILVSVKKVADLNNEIAAASSEQTTGIQQINKAMNQLDSGAQANAASSEEIASTAEEISSQTSQMQSLVTELTTFVVGDAYVATKNTIKSETAAKKIDFSKHKATNTAPQEEAKVVEFKKPDTKKSPPTHKATSAGSSKDLIPFDEDEPARKVGTTDGF